MTDKELYKQAKKRVEAKRSVYIHAAVYVIVNTFLVVLYFITSVAVIDIIDTATVTNSITINGATLTSIETAGNYFWPIWPMMGWGIGLAIHAAAVFFSLKNFDSEVEKEFIKLKATSGEKFSHTDSAAEDSSSREN